MDRVNRLNQAKTSQETASQVKEKVKATAEVPGKDSRSPVGQAEVTPWTTSTGISTARSLKP